MVCDPTSNSFMANTVRFRTVLSGWNAPMGDMAMTDLFLRILNHNKKTRPPSTSVPSSESQTKLKFPFTVGTCPETMFPNRVQHWEHFNDAFKLKHQVEVIANS